MKYFTSDLHLGDPRFHLFYRPFKSVEQQTKILIKNINDTVATNDELYIVGDVCYSLDHIKYLKNIKCKNIIIIQGNYDLDNKEKIPLLKQYTNVLSENTIRLGDNKIYLNHYPTECVNKMNNDNTIDLSITGHIHSLWKVQPKIINVSVECWGYKPVSEDELLFCWNAMQKFYDEDVYPYTYHLAKKEI